MKYIKSKIAQTDRTEQNNVQNNYLWIEFDTKI